MDEIARSTIERLPLYKKTMEDLLLAGRTHVSSDEIADKLRLNDAQIRKDLNHFGNFGVRGKGYEIQSLVDRITEILGTHQVCKCILVGVGNLGQALLSYGGFQEHNFRIEKAYDVDPTKTGETFGETPVLDFDNLSETLQSDTELAILAVPAEAGEEVINQLIEEGIKGILNFAPFVPQTPEDVIVESVDLSTNLEVLAYFLNNSTELLNK